MTRVVIVGSGGREHALATALADSAEVVVTPGSAGIPGSNRTQPQFLEADLFIIGPEGPLVSGLADELRFQGKTVLGSGQDGAKLEGSKIWMKEVLDEAKLPTARWAAFRDLEAAREYLEACPLSDRFVIKTDGLAAGKGVFVAPTRIDALEDARKKLSGESFGEAGRAIVIEEQLVGRELSVMAVCNGHTAVLLPVARDYKRLLDGDHGPNTGGMGAYSTSTESLEEEDYVLEMVERTLAVLRSKGIDYRGVLYVGLMFTADGPKIIEYNVRFGDPETQVILPRITGGLLACLMQAAEGRPMTPPGVSDNAVVTVALASEGYPDEPRTGDVISGIGGSEERHMQLLHAGTVERPFGSGRYLTAGGRVLYVTAKAATIEQARNRVYAAVDKISWTGMQYRGDIAQGQ